MTKQGRFLHVKPVVRLDYHQQTESLLDEMTDVLIKKNNDYSKAGDAYSNFRTGEEWGVDVLKSIRLRMGDKLQRIDSFLSGADMENESIEDSYRDVIGYSVLSIIALQHLEDKQP